MATYERSPLMTFKDKGGNKYLLYPITKTDCVDGLEEALANKPDKTVPAAAGNLAGLNAEGGLTDSGKKPGDFAAASHSHAYGEITGKPSAFAPATHKASHATGGTDALTPGEIGAAAASHSHAPAAIQQDASNRFVTDAEKTAWNGKANASHTHNASDITAGTLPITRGGTGYTTVTDTTYSTARYRASALFSTEKAPTTNGVINWTYK